MKHFSACSDGSFGRNCNEKCGKCLGKEQFDHVNGTCVKGCNPGIYGIMCTEGSVNNVNVKLNYKSFFFYFACLPLIFKNICFIIQTHIFLSN